MIKIIIQGIPPAKKNGKQWVVRGTRRFLVPSEAYQNWHEIATYEVTRQIGPVRQKLPLHVVKMEVTYFVKDKKRRDSDNATTSVLDLFVDLGIIKDDSMVELPDIRMIYGGIVRENPRTEIVIETYEPKT